MSRPQNLPEGFISFWEAYPRRVAKGSAYKAWVTQDCEPIAAEIVKAVKKAQWADDKKFIPHAATWLNSWRWEDEDEGNSADNALRDALR